MITKRKYNCAFKERVIKLSCERNSMTEFTSELGVLPDRMIYSWREEFADYGSASFLGHGIERLSDEYRRVKDLNKQLKNHRVIA